MLRGYHARQDTVHLTARASPRDQHERPERDQGEHDLRITKHSVLRPVDDGRGHFSALQDFEPRGQRNRIRHEPFVEAHATTRGAAPITSAGRFSPRGPLGIANLYLWNHVQKGRITPASDF